MIACWVEPIEEAIAEEKEDRNQDHCIKYYDVTQSAMVCVIWIVTSQKGWNGMGAVGGCRGAKS